MNLEWITYSSRPRIWHLYQNNKLMGFVYRGIDDFDVYIEGETFTAQRACVAKMPILDEAKNLLQTLIGVQHA